MNARWPKGLFILLAVWASAYFRHIYPQLPSVVASHFDQHGIANGWETKQTFFDVFAALTLLSAVFVFGLPKIIAAMPAAIDQSAEQRVLAGAGAVAGVDGVPECMAGMVWVRGVRRDHRGF